jgi:CTP:molybdopterin cytidylyltransferase MocA
MGAFKPLLPLGNATILQRVLDTLKSGGAEDLAVITGKNAGLIEAALRGSAVQIIHNQDYETTDMFYSAMLGMPLLAKQAGAVFFTPVDVPLFSADTVERLLAELRRRGAGIAIPCFNENPGHPVLFSSAAVAELAGYTGGGGLRGAIAAYRGPKALLPVDDPGVVFDTDTPAEYRLIQLMAELNMPGPVKEHCLLVSRLAHAMAAALAAQGLALHLRDIETAALLHDMRRTESGHAEAGARVLRELGLEGPAAIVASHMKLEERDLDAVNERVIVYLADKMARGARPVTLEARFAKKLASLPTEAGKAAVRDNYQRALAAKRRIEGVLGQDLYALLKIPGP